MNLFLEIVSFITGIFSVYLATNSNKHTFTLGIISNISLMLFGLINNLYGTFILNLILALICIIGYKKWSVSDEIQITFDRDIFINASILTITLLLGFSLFYNDIDVMISMIGMGATYLLIKRHYLNWIFWIIMDFFFIVFYISESHYIIALQYGFFLLLCFKGINDWIKQLEKSRLGVR